jgi:hypothetical protein
MKKKKNPKQRGARGRRAAVRDKTLVEQVLFLFQSCGTIVTKTNLDASWLALLGRAVKMFDR